MSKVYAGIGSRKLTQDEWRFCWRIGRWLATQGWTLRTGAAFGADQAFAEGALNVGGSVVLCLPSPSYEFKWVEPARGMGATRELLQYWHEDAFASVEKYHPKPERLKDLSRKLHARNYLIVAPAKFVIAWPKSNRYGLGGTGQGIRIAAGLKIHTIRLDEPIDYARVASTIPA